MPCDGFERAQVSNLLRDCEASDECYCFNDCLTCIAEAGKNRQQQGDESGQSSPSAAAEAARLLASRMMIM